jgi:hypothetical protein
MLNEMKFDATKFESRTMPTPDLKGKEVIYWIKVETNDKVLASDLQRFLGRSGRQIELRVPSAFVAARTELEEYRSNGLDNYSQLPEARTNSLQEQRSESKFVLEIILRRLLPETRSGQIQSPYG